jgi:hypothetical protein
MLLEGTMDFIIIIIIIIIIFIYYRIKELCIKLVIKTSLYFAALNFIQVLKYSFFLNITQI